MTSFAAERSEPRARRLQAGGTAVLGLNPREPVDAIFVNSPLKDYDTASRFNDYTLPVLGIGYIATVAKANGLNVGVLDAEACGIGIGTAAAIVSDLRPRWVGMNMLAPTYRFTTAILRGLDPSIQVMLGGHQVKAMPDEILIDSSIPFIDALIIGEAELRAAAILADTDRRNDLPGVRWRDRRTGFPRAGGRRLVDDRKWLSPDINALPFVHRGFMKDDPRSTASGLVRANMVGSRGCPYNCTFCGAAAEANPDVDVRTRDPQNLIAEMHELRDRYSVNSIRFVDDLFLAQPRFMEKCLGLFVTEGVGDDFTWDATGRINVLTRANSSMLELMVASGCREVALGIESGSERLLNYMGKKITPEMTKESVTKLLDHGISVKGYYIFGYPTETQAELESSVAQIHELWTIADGRPGDFRASAFEFRPYPGTREWNRLIENGHSVTEMLDYSYVDLTESGASEEMRSRDEFNFSVGIQFGPPLVSVRDSLGSITREQYERLQSA